ncbi:hypothetical protein RhiJN_05968 [Ceratobasidium sp. AG-Ba]|nr:hypothetical protein RhiJN_05968 [Ceratobasidium sp. AG-Ba]QRW06898.1 hypothetical protein RhiLY_05897 [Ceratobasidium sp. AG-Ba]
MKFVLVLFGVLALVSATCTPARLTQAQAEARLKPQGISASSSGGCTTQSIPTCTSYRNIRCTTVAGVINLKVKSRCPITITGGTEVGHKNGTYSHYNGYKVDLKKVPCLNNFIHSKYKQIANRSDGFPQWKTPEGNIYCDEGNHWDVTYYR